MVDYLEAIDRMVEELRSDARVRLDNYARFEPAPATAMEEVRSLVGGEIDPAIRDFFGASNGLQLRWNFGLPGEEVGGAFPWDMPWTERLQDHAVINILPIERIFLDDWKDFTWYDDMGDAATEDFLGKTYPLLEFRHRIKPCDIFSGSETVSVFLDEEAKRQIVLLSEDNLADHLSSKITDFATYLEFLVASKGVVAERREAFRDEWNSSASPKQLVRSLAAK